MEPLFNILQHRGIKVRWLARQVGLSDTMMSRVKKGKRRMPERVRPQIASILGLPEAVLFTGDTEQDTSKQVS